MKRPDDSFRDVRRFADAGRFLTDATLRRGAGRIILIDGTSPTPDGRTIAVAYALQAEGYNCAVVAAAPTRRTFACGQVGGIPTVLVQDRELRRLKPGRPLKGPLKTVGIRVMALVMEVEADLLYSFGLCGLDFAARSMREVAYRRRIGWAHEMRCGPDGEGPSPPGAPVQPADAAEARLPGTRALLTRSICLPDIVVLPSAAVSERLADLVHLPPHRRVLAGDYSDEGDLADDGDPGSHQSAGIAALRPALARLLPDGKPPARGVFQGPHTSAGQPYLLAHALRRRGQPAESAHLGRKTRLNLATDSHWPGTSLRRRGAFALWAVERFELFHLHFCPILNRYDTHGYLGPAFQDMALMKQAGLPIVFHFRGSEARLHAAFKAHNPYAWDDPTYPTGFGDPVKRQLIETVRELADAILVPDPELQTYIPEARIVPRLVDLDRLAYSGPVNRDRPMIVHAPTRREAKGSDAVLAAVRQLRAEGLAFDFVLLEGLDHDQLLDRLRGADIVVDQLRIGWYGVLSLEAMALGKVPVAYLRADLDHHVPEDALVRANPDDITAVLRGLLADPERRARVGRAARAWAEAHHGPDAVVSRLKQIYAEVRSAPIKPPSPRAFGLQIDAAMQLTRLQAVTRWMPRALTDEPPRHRRPSLWIQVPKFLLKGGWRRRE